MAQDDAIGKLAKQIEAAATSERFLADAAEIAALRRQGACELHRICAEFAGSVNQRLSKAALELEPAVYHAEAFRDEGINLFQIASRGRELQVTFQAPEQLVSTAKFLQPYVLEGEIRAYNQEMLERFTIRTVLLFFCIEGAAASWRFFDWRTARTGPVDSNLMANLMQPLF